MTFASGCRSPAPTSRPSSPVNSTPTARIVDFAPGVRLNYRIPQVEIDAEVILRDGPLELFAYSRAPVPKEHESILRLEASAETIFRALGLIGLTPGRPLRFIPETGKTELPTGDPVDVLVRYQRNGEFVEQSACDWMIDVERNAPMHHTHWLFTGSTRREDGAFEANNEGTTIVVVNFTSALLSLPTLHTDRDADLWLAANTPAIPLKGTKVTLLLRPATQSSH